jgi:opacity protein-like surface antigen
MALAVSQQSTTGEITMLRKAIAAIVLGSTLTIPALPQDSAEFGSDATVQAFGSFVKKTVDNGVHQSATDSGGVLATYRLFFNRHHGVEFNYGYALNTQKFGSAGLRADSHEATAAYVFRIPLQRWTPFVLAGAGGLVFHPKDEAVAAFLANTQARPAFVYGAGADVNLTSRIFLRAQYRGFVYNSPHFDSATLVDVERTTHRAEPSAGIGFRF